MTKLKACTSGGGASSPKASEKCPCYPGPRPKPGGLGAYDAPSAKRPGLTLFYEVAAICLNKKNRRPFPILGSMRWSYSDQGLAIMKTPDGKVDHGDASVAFKLAVDDYIALFGQKCCPRPK